MKTSDIENESVVPGEDGRMRDRNGNYGYFTHLSHLWVCYTCGHLCECEDISQAERDLK